MIHSELHILKEYKKLQRQRRFLKKIKKELPYDPAIPLLGIYPEKMKTLIQKDTRTPIFTAALFRIAKI